MRGGRPVLFLEAIPSWRVPVLGFHSYGRHFFRDGMLSSPPGDFFGIRFVFDVQQWVRAHSRAPFFLFNTYVGHSSLYMSVRTTARQYVHSPGRIHPCYGSVVERSCRPGGWSDSPFCVLCFVFRVFVSFLLSCVCNMLFSCSSIEFYVSRVVCTIRLTNKS